MAESTHDGSPNIFPALRYRDAPAAIAWLGRAFGFVTKMEISEPDGKIAHAELKLGPGLIMLGSKRGPDDANNPRDDDRSLYIYVADVDAHHDRAKAAGAEIIRDLTDTDYGSREYSVRDPEGYVWSFGTYRP